ncbi:MAG: NADH-quinone oxidoreductase subunit NuoE [Spirochaetaceae bacterium]|nr:MAG: NADH-quinone oxidoreductase subunit NuoE [Spirochaetaceae bacterium]
MIMTAEDKYKTLEEYISSFKNDLHPESRLIGVLHKAQELFGFLPEEVMCKIAYLMDIPAARIWGVASFYHYFNLKPVGKHVISLCLGTACYVKGAGMILDRIREHLNISVGETTTDGMFTLQEARCLGACGLAPVLMIDNKIHGKLTPEAAIELINGLKKG